MLGMKPCLILTLLLGAGVLASATTASDRPPLHEDPEAITVMSYNLRFAGADPAHPDAWEKRRETMIALLRRQQPDLIGTQEGLLRQLEDLAAALPEYRWIGKGREVGGAGEHMAILYRAERFTPLEVGHFWLSETPDVAGSKSWDAANVRMVTHVLFEDRLTGRKFHFWNSHFDHVSQEARQKAAEMVLKRVAALSPPLPILFTADFNAAAREDPIWQQLVGAGRFRDAWDEASERVHEKANTFNQFQQTLWEGRRIDWILAQGAFEVGKAEIVLPREGERLASDHHPVQIRLRLREE